MIMLHANYPLILMKNRSTPGLLLPESVTEVAEKSLPGLRVHLPQHMVPKALGQLWFKHTKKASKYI